MQCSMSWRRAGSSSLYWKGWASTGTPPASRITSTERSMDSIFRGR